MDPADSASGEADSVVRFERVGVRRLSGRHVVPILHDASFDLAPGEFLGLRGPRRSGKTTLLRIAAGIDVPDSGAVSWHVDRAPAAPRRARARRLREIGFVPQAQAWRSAPGKSMLDHIALPLLIQGCSLAEADAKARAAAERVNALSYVDGTPQELPADALMRLALARALVRDPRVLILDDLASAASSAGLQELQALLLDLLAVSGGRLSLIAASRDVSALHGADRIMSLDGSGRLGVSDRPSARVVDFPRLESVP